MSIIFHSGSDKTNIGGDTYMAGIGDVYEIYMKKNICTWDGTRQTDILLLCHLPTSSRKTIGPNMEP